jgi:predicted DNA binding CopG/RHH family protein
MEKLKIPETASIDELATFWDTRDLTDFEDQLVEVTGPVFLRGVESIAVPLRSQEVQAVRRIAESQGIDYISLIQGWVLEKLQSSWVKDTLPPLTDPFLETSPRRGPRSLLPHS